MLRVYRSKKKSPKPKRKLITKKYSVKKKVSVKRKKLSMGLFQSKLYKQFIKEQEDLYRQKFHTQLIHRLPEEIKKSINLYSDSSYEFINAKGKYIAHRNNLLEAFERIPPLENNIVLFRGLEHVDSLDMKQLDNKRFNSATFTRKVAYEEFSGDFCCMLVINVSSGSKVLPMIYYSKYFDEFEVLLPPYGTWELISEEIINGQKTYFLNYKN